MMYSYFMRRRLILIVPTFIVAFGILFVSVLRSASVKYEFTGSVNNTPSEGSADSEIDYELPFPGKVLPDNLLWTLKVIRDRAWLLTTTNSNREAELLLLFADKRLLASQSLFERGKAEIGYETLTKAEEYLNNASLTEFASRQKGIETADLLTRLASSSLKHRQIIEEVIIPLAPEDAKPEILHTTEKSKRVYEESAHALNEKGLDVPPNPFDGKN